MMSQLRTGTAFIATAFVLLGSIQHAGGLAGSPLTLAMAPAEAAQATPIPEPGEVPGDDQEPARPATPARTIVIDPGHGGTDIGVTGQSGAQEKMLALDIALRLRTLFGGREDLRILLTREDDRELGLDDRAAFANSNRADLFLSLHMNASLSPSHSGAEVYRMSTDSGPALGGRSGLPLLAVPAAEGGTRSIVLVPWDDAQSRHRESSTMLASLMEASLRTRVPMSNRPLREAPLRVLAGVDMPAVVVELAYLSNPEQEQSALAGTFVTLAAEAIAEAVEAFEAASPEGR